MPPHNNVIGTDPELTDPEHGDFRPLPGSPAEGYGCLTFPDPGPGGTGAAAEPAGTGTAAEPGGTGTAAEPAGTGTAAEPGDARPTTATAVRSEAPGLIEGAGPRGSRGLIEGAGPRGSRGLIEVSGLIASPQTWTADTVLVVGNVTVDVGVRLTIAPGVQVLFADTYALHVQGALRAEGTPAHPIRFDSRHPELFAIDSTDAGSWRGIRFAHTSSANDSSRLAHCVIAHCKVAGDGGRGGALCVDRFSKLAVFNTLFRDNVADYGPVIYCQNFAAPLLAGCVCHGNHAFVAGGAAYCQDAYPAFVACTMVGNTVHNDGIFVGTAAIHNHISKAVVAGSIVRDNPTHYFLGGEIYEGKGAYVTYCDVSGGHAGAGNFDADPLFIDSGAHPFALREGSPCIDAGLPPPCEWPLPATDPLGNPRIVDDRLDAGAYEWSPVAAVAVPAGGTHARLTLHGASPLAGGAPAVLELALDRPARVRLIAYDVEGRVRAVLLDGSMPAGTQRVTWEPALGGGAAREAGLRWVGLEIDGRRVAARKVLWIR